MAIFDSSQYRNDAHLRRLRTAKEIGDYLGFSRDVISTAMDRLPDGSVDRQSKAKLLINHDALLDELHGKQQRTKKTPVSDQSGLEPNDNVVEPELVVESGLTKYDLESLQNGYISHLDSRVSGLENRLSTMEKYALALLSNQDKHMALQESQSNELKAKVEQLLQFQKLTEQIDRKEYATELEAARQRAIALEIDKELAANEARMEFRLGKKFVNGLKS